MEIRTNRDSYKNRNKNKISTLIGNEQVYLDILDLEFEADKKTINLKSILEKTFENQSRLEEINSNLLKEISNLNTKMTELKQALKEYISTENIVDSANTNSIEILSQELSKCNLRLAELEDKTKFL